MIRKILRSILCGLLVLICLFFAVVGIGKHQLGKMWFFEDRKISFWMKESTLKSELGQPAETVEPDKDQIWRELRYTDVKFTFSQQPFQVRFMIDSQSDRMECFLAETGFERAADAIALRDEIIAAIHEHYAGVSILISGYEITDGVCIYIKGIGALYVYISQHEVGGRWFVGIEAHAVAFGSLF